MYKIFLVLFVLSVNFSFSRNISLTASGGVSLGSYEAGYLYYMISTRDKNKDPSGKIVTGASAGAINSFVSVLEYCALERKEAEKSLFWKSWIPTSYSKLSSGKWGDPRNIFSRESFSGLFSELEQAWKKGLVKGCTFKLGVSVTRKQPLTYFQKNVLDYPRGTEVIAFEVTGQGKGIEPLVRNLKIQKSGVDFLLPFNSSKWTNFELMKKLFLASSAFPLAFAPVKLPHCLIERKKSTKCDESKVRIDEFIDGGVFNNGPLDLAYNIAKLDNSQDDTVYIYMDPEFKNYPLPIRKNEKNSKGSLLSVLLDFSKNFVSSSRTSQVAKFLGEHPELINKIQTTKGSFPLASEAFYNFFGFFERDFRVFDFYAGMLDAKILQIGLERKVSFKELRKMNVQSKRLECLYAVSSGNIELLNHCRKKQILKNQNFRALLLTSVERLFRDCEELALSQKTKNKFCRMSSKGVKIKDLFPDWLDGIKPKKKESDIALIMRRLAQHGFVFKDLEVPEGEEKFGVLRLKQKLGKTLIKASKRQPKAHELVMRKLTPSLLNYISYSPKPFDRYILISSNALSIGYTKAFSKKSKLGLYTRYGHGLMLTGIDHAFYEGKFSLGVSPYIGFYAEVEKFSNPAWQFRLGTRFAYQFSSHENFKAQKCDVNPRRRIEFSKCSHFMTQFLISTSIFESFKVELVYQRAPFVKNMPKKPDYYSLMFGWQF